MAHYIQYFHCLCKKIILMQFHVKVKIWHYCVFYQCFEALWGFIIIFSKKVCLFGTVLEHNSWNHTLNLSYLTDVLVFYTRNLSNYLTKNNFSPSKIGLENY